MKYIEKYHKGATCWTALGHWQLKNILSIRFSGRFPQVRTSTNNPSTPHLFIKDDFLQNNRGKGGSGCVRREHGLATSSTGTLSWTVCPICRYRCTGHIGERWCIVGAGAHLVGGVGDHCGQCDQCDHCGQQFSLFTQERCWVKRGFLSFGAIPQNS